MEDFVHYINLKDKVNYQVVYSSQVYGTFFSIYSKFDAELNETTNEFLINKIDFKLINYKGILNMGITNVKGPNHYQDELDQAGITNLKLFNIEVRALKPQEYPFTEGGFTMKSDDTMFIQRTLRRLDDTDRPINDDGIFDEEFYFREGIRELNDYDDSLPRPHTEMPNLSSIDFGFKSGTLCPTSKIVVM